MNMDELYKMVSMNKDGTSKGYKICLCDRCAGKYGNKETKVELDDERIFKKTCMYCGCHEGYIRKVSKNNIAA